LPASIHPAALPLPAPFLSTTRPPHRSTLFPYTTSSDLFRRRFRRQGPHHRHREGHGHHRRRPQGRRSCAAEGVRRAGQGAQGRRDRKSTRLNSSHVKNPYAVVSMKKKNQTWRIVCQETL